MVYSRSWPLLLPFRTVPLPAPSIIFLQTLVTRGLSFFNEIIIIMIIKTAQNCVMGNYSIHVYYHWQKLAQVSFLSRQTFCRDKHNFIATSILLLRQKTCFVVTNTCLLRQKCCLWHLRPMILYMHTHTLVSGHASIIMDYSKLMYTHLK